MWFDVKTALAEVLDKTPAPGSRVAHVARVARPPALKSGNPRGRQDGPDSETDDRAHGLSPDDRDAYEERAAILEFDAHFPRAVAERRARLDVMGVNHRSSPEINNLTRLWPPEDRS